jgi:hypothetical protein
LALFEKSKYQVPNLNIKTRTEGRPPKKFQASNFKGQTNHDSEIPSQKSKDVLGF